MVRPAKGAGVPVALPFAGTWTYRSFKDDPDPSKHLDQLEVAQGDLIIYDAPPGSFHGRLVFDPTHQYKLTGASSLGNPFTILFRGFGDAEGSRGQVYDYVGYLAPIWPSGKDQCPTLIGSILRTVAHGDRPAGEVFSWVAVRRADKVRRTGGGR